jgi:hypothetical protein
LNRLRRLRRLRRLNRLPSEVRSGDPVAAKQKGRGILLPFSGSGRPCVIADLAVAPSTQLPNGRGQAGQHVTCHRARVPDFAPRQFTRQPVHIGAAQGRFKRFESLRQ